MYSRPSPQKKIGKERLWFTVDNRVQRPRDFFRNVWKMIWLVISHTSLHHWNSEIWLAFIFVRFAIGAFRTESFTFVRDNNMMWDFDDEFVRSLWRRHRKKTRIKILLLVEGAILLKFERNCCLWSVKSKSIPRTFVGIVFARWRNEGRS